MPDILLTVFTKPWTDPLPQLADTIAALGVDGVEFPVRPGYQVEPDRVAQGLPEAVEAFRQRQLRIMSVAGSVDERTIAACGDSGIPTIRIFAPIDPKAGYAASFERYRRQFDAVLPHLERFGVGIGVQNHSGNCIGSAMGLLHLIEPYEPKHVSAVLDMAHCTLAGEPAALALDIIWPRVRGLVNFKSAYRERTNGPEEAEAAWRIRWTTARHGGFSWSELARDVRGRGFQGAFCLPAEYSDPGGKPQRMGSDVLPFLRDDVATLKTLAGAPA